MRTYTVKEQAAIWGCEERQITRWCREGRIFGAERVGREWLIPEDSDKPSDKRTKDGIKTDREIKTPANVSFDPIGGRQHVIDAFVEKYHRDPASIAFTPYRICPLGAHVDHNLGKITGFALDKGIYMAYGPKMNGIVEVSSLQFDKRAQWFIGSTPVKKEGDWADHLRGATIALNERYPLRIGISAILDGELPIGGLSSSAAVIITFLHALCRLNNIRLHHEEFITIAQEAENKYVGVSCGRLDQSCEIYCREDNLLYMDMKDLSHRNIPTSPKMKPYEFAIFFSGLEHNLASSKFNMRVDELRSAAYACLAFANMPYGKFKETSMRDVPYEVYLKHKDKLPENWRKRADHWYSECHRVEEGAKAWENGDIDAFGKLIFESGYSSIHNYETGSPELKELYEIMTRTKGIYGGRFSGAGFKGCCMALIDPAYEQEILAKVKEEYCRAFPRLADRYCAFICHTADGVHLSK